MQGASCEPPARSAVPPPVPFEQPQTVDGKPPSGQAAADKHKHKYNLIEGVALKDTQRRGERVEQEAQ